MRSVLVVVALGLLGCGGSVDEGTAGGAAGVSMPHSLLDDCNREPLSTAKTWCDRAHPLAFYCQASPEPNYCVAVKVSTDGTGDALYCCDPAGLE
jgi:hypothetical protein